MWRIACENWRKIKLVPLHQCAGLRRGLGTNPCRELNLTMSPPLFALSTGSVRIFPCSGKKSPCCRLESLRAARPPRSGGHAERAHGRRPAAAQGPAARRAWRGRRPSTGHAARRRRGVRRAGERQGMG